jgi:hypothetical protein
MEGWKVELRTDAACVRTVSASFDAREVVLSDDEDAVIPIGDEGFTVSGGAGELETEEISPKEYEEQQREHERRACRQQANSGISNILSCIDGKRRVGRKCPSAKVAKAAVDPLVESELGRGAKVVIEGEGDCFTGWSIDRPSGEVRLDATSKP